MSSLMDVPNLNQRVHRVTVDFYHQLTALGLVKKQTELIRGVIVNKMSKSPLHVSISKRLAELLGRLIPASFSVRRDDPLTLADSEPEPDVAVVAGTDDKFWNSHPTTAELVVEIAVTSLNDDREMAPIYAEAGVKEFWIVVVPKHEVEVYRSPEGGQYREQRTYTEQEILACESLPKVSLPVADIFAAPSKEAR